MDQRIEPRNIAQEFKVICNDYKSHYFNKHDKLASLLIEQTDILIKKYPSTHFINTALCCFTMAAQNILIKEGSGRFLNMLHKFTSDHHLESDISFVKDTYAKDILLITNYLNKNKNRGFFSAPTVFDFDALWNNYQQFEESRTFVDEKRRKEQFRRITQEEADFLEQLCNDIIPDI